MGYQKFVISESKNRLYYCGLEPYLGKHTTENLTRPDLLVTSQIVLHLIEKLKDDYSSVEGFHVFTDRYYTSVELASALYDMKVHLTGTIMRNRKGLPVQVRTVRKNQQSKKKVPTIKLNKGEYKAFLMLWKDTNEVTMLTILYDASTQTVRQVKKEGVRT